MRDSGAVKALRYARKLIEKEENWTQKISQRVKPSSSWWKRLLRIREFSYCATGALHKAVPAEVNYYDVYGILKAAAEIGGYSTPVFLNDKTNHVEVLQMFDRAIAIAEAA